VAGKGKFSAPAAQKPKGVLGFFIENRIGYNIKTFSNSKKCEFFVQNHSQIVLF
jgi:hypothetical protein